MSARKPVERLEGELEVQVEGQNKGEEIKQKHVAHLSHIIHQYGTDRINAFRVSIGYHSYCIFVRSSTIKLIAYQYYGGYKSSGIICLGSVQADVESVLDAMDMDWNDESAVDHGVWIGGGSNSEYEHTEQIRVMNERRDKHKPPWEKRSRQERWKADADRAMAAKWSSDLKRFRK